MVDLLALADRVEKLTGPDRVVDALIADAIRWWPEGFNRIDYFGRDRRRNDKASPLPEKIDCPQWSASLDAAMTLVPEGFKWRCGYSRHVPHNAEVVDYNNHKGTFIGESDFNRACAITAACLRARASTDKGEA